MPEELGAGSLIRVSLKSETYDVQNDLCYADSKAGIVCCSGLNGTTHGQIIARWSKNLRRRLDGTPLLSYLTNDALEELPDVYDGAYVLVGKWHKDWHNQGNTLSAPTINEVVAVYEPGRVAAARYFTKTLCGVRHVDMGWSSRFENSRNIEQTVRFLAGKKGRAIIISPSDELLSQAIIATRAYPAIPIMLKPKLQYLREQLSRDATSRTEVTEISDVSQSTTKRPAE